MVGVGLNVRAQRVDDAAAGVASLDELDARRDARGDARARAARPRRRPARFDDEGFAPFAERFAARDLLQGLTVAGGGADAEVVGEAAGIGASGALLLRTADGLRAVESGEWRAARRPSGPDRHAESAARGAGPRQPGLLRLHARRGFDGLLGDREPERPQVRPQSIKLLPNLPNLPTLPAAAAASAAGEAATCFETPAFAAAEAAAVETVLAASLPAGSWTDVRGERVSGARSETTHLYRDRQRRRGAGGAAPR